MKLLEADGFVRRPPFFLNGATGLIGQARRLTKNTLECDCTVNGLIVPGGRVLLTSKTANGTYRADTIRHVGNNRGGEFRTTVLLRNVDAIVDALS